MTWFYTRDLPRSTMFLNETLGWPVVLNQGSCTVHNPPGGSDTFFVGVEPLSSCNTKLILSLLTPTGRCVTQGRLHLVQATRPRRLRRSPSLCSLVCPYDAFVRMQVTYTLVVRSDSQVQAMSAWLRNEKPQVVVDAPVLVPEWNIFGFDFFASDSETMGCYRFSFQHFEDSAWPRSGESAGDAPHHSPLLTPHPTALPRWA